MIPSNDPDIALAQEWVGELDAYIREHGLRGYDPFDIKAHPRIRALQTRRFARRAATVASDIAPYTMRRWLGVEPTENPKAHALVALGLLRLHTLSPDMGYLDRARQHLGWLDVNRCPDVPGLAWGYPFPVFATGIDTPAGTPILVVCAIAAQAYHLAYRITQDASYLDALREIGNYVVAGIPRLEESDGTFCFAYAPTDHRRVHNANLLGVELLFRIAAETGDESTRSLADRALAFTLDRQAEDGSWPYGAYAPSEPLDVELLSLVDHHHTGYVLRSLHAIQALSPQDRVKEALKNGFPYYRDHLFGPSGEAVNGFRKYPIDIHACAEAILCPSVLSDTFIGARTIPHMAMRWTHFNLRNPADSTPYHKKYYWFTAKLCCTRWGVAWLYYALAEYLCSAYPSSVPRPAKAG